MGKTTQRKERNEAKELRALFTSNPDHFVRVWNRRLKGWCGEVVARGRDMKRGKSKTPPESVYGILEKAERLLQMIGAEAERLVGVSTRQTLRHECSKAVAMATDPHIYLFETDSVYRLMATKSDAKRIRG